MANRPRTGAGGARVQLERWKWNAGTAGELTLTGGSVLGTLVFRQYCGVLFRLVRSGAADLKARHVVGFVK